MTAALGAVGALTLDLDDTLWPVRPALVAAEKALAEWLRLHAPATARGMAPGAMLALRARVLEEHPHWSHDLSAIRLETIRRALRRHGDDPTLAELAFEVFFDARHAVTFYDDVLTGLERLASRYRLVAVSNGNAEVQRIGLARFFSGSVSARLHGVAKPDASIFLAACAAAGAAPAQVLHLGDDLDADIGGALGAGLQAGWICRPDGVHASADPHAGAHRFADLIEVALALGV